MNTTESLDNTDREILLALFDEYFAYCYENGLTVDSVISLYQFLENQVMPVEVLLRKLFRNRIDTVDFGE